ncbi:NUDIX hydrolase [Thermobifida halotolerans]|uniref:NUDIX hydrolase n=1 Tax=Thermobifida halotolerans TaxID=483545 RepID=A0A399G024_9ACTN|nr:NUDIX hydrolase [Thermobifida halotolerans]UOE19131.1 NUDIX hydrolase [Thermobifida halotolerans]
MFTGDGDGWVTLADGSQRWGLHGASGLLLHSVDESGIGHVLLQHRAPWTHQGDTWGLPGGARNSGESSVEAALREFAEEVAGELGALSLFGIHRQDYQVWAFDTVLANIPERRPFSPGNPESQNIRWVPVHEVPSMPLIPAFGRVWPEVAAALSERLLLIVDATAPVRRPESVEPLRDGLAELARTGITDDALPPELSLSPLHQRFPSVLLLVDARARVTAPMPAPGVEVVPVFEDSADAVTRLARRYAARACAVVATDDPDARTRSAAAGAHPVPASWARDLAAAALRMELSG